MSIRNLTVLEERKSLGKESKGPVFGVMSRRKYLHPLVDVMIRDMIGLGRACRPSVGPQEREQVEDLIIIRSLEASHSTQVNAI